MARAYDSPPAGRTEAMEAQKTRQTTQQSIGMRGRICGGGECLTQHNNQPSWMDNSTKNKRYIHSSRAIIAAAITGKQTQQPTGLMDRGRIERMRLVGGGGGHQQQTTITGGFDDAIFLLCACII
eukprot:scaffold114518_cov83-Cyclotella_meneghiniana.AAC.1